MVEFRWPAQKHRVGKSMPLADCDRRQVHPARHIAHRKDRGHRRLAIVIDHDLALATQRHAQRRQPQTVGVGMPPGGVHHQIKLPLRPVGGHGEDAGRGPFQPHHIGAAANGHTTGLHRGGDMAARLVIKAAQDLRAPVILADLDPQAVQDASKFARDIAAADHQRAGRQLVQMEHLVRGDGQLRPGNIGHEGTPAGGHQDVPGADLLPAGQPDGVGIDQHRAGVMDHHPGGGERAAIRRLQPVQLRLQHAAKSRPVEPAHRHIPAIAAGILHRLRKARGEDHQLFRHAPPDHAGAAHPAFLGQRHPCTALGTGDPRRAHPARPAADDEKIIVECHRSTRRQTVAAVTDLCDHRRRRKAAARAIAQMQNTRCGGTGCLEWFVRGRLA